MKADERTRIAVRLAEHIRAGTTDLDAAPLIVPLHEYIDPGVAREEIDAVLTRTPLVVAASSELPAAGDFVTRDLLGVPVLMRRTDTGQVLAFRNTCRHRGAQLEWEESGNRRIFSCRYHGWAFNGDGSLRNMTGGEAFEGVDPTNCNLVSLGAGEAHGLVYVALDRPGPIDLRGFLGDDLDDELTSWDISNHRLEREASFVEPMNWKVALDGLLDNYHLKYLHKASVSPLFHTNLAAVDTFGPHSRLVAPRRSLDEHLPAIDTDPASVDVIDHVILNYQLFPNTVLVRQPHHYEAWTILPDHADPGTSVTHLRYLVPPGEPSERDQRRWDKSWDILMSAIQPEDLVVGRSIQRGFARGGSGPMVIGRNEISIQHLHRGLDRARQAHTEHASNPTPR